MLATTPNVEAATCSPVFYYYHTDHLGSSNVITDRSGLVAHHYEYGAYGKTTYSEENCSFKVSNRYTGQIFDEETGLYYYGARYYDPELGRFTQADTIVPSAANPQTLNRYAYCGNNPLKYVDPSGHSFLGSIFNAIGSALTNPSTWAGVAVGFIIAGPPGALIGLAVTVAITAVSAAVGYVAGMQAGMITGAVLSVALAAYGISKGVGMIGTDNTRAYTAIASSALSIGSSSATLAGQPDLATALGYASLGVSLVGPYVGHALESRHELPPEMKEAGITIDEKIPNWRNNQIIRSLAELFQTDVGKQMMIDISEGGGLKVMASTTGDSEDEGPGAIGVSRRGPYGLGRKEALRGLFHPADEFRVVLMSGVDQTKIMAWNLGHEIGHAVYNYDDHWQKGAGPLNLTRIENPLRTQLGISIMRVHYMGTRVLP